MNNPYYIGPQIIHMVFMVCNYQQVFIQPELGHTSIISRQKDGGLKFFSTKQEGNALADAILLQKGENQLNSVVVGH